MDRTGPPNAAQTEIIVVQTEIIVVQTEIIAVPVV
jgi:hypothetical protein